MRGIIQYVRRGLLTAINQSPIYKFVSDNLIEDSGLIDPTNNWVATGDFSFVAGRGAFYYADSNEGMIRPEDQFFQNYITKGQYYVLSFEDAQIFLDKAKDLVEFLKSNEISIQPLFPVTSARFQRLDSKKEIDRTFNFTWMDKLPEGNEVIAGKWFENENNGISISSEISERYELQVNDRIVIDVAGKKINSHIQSIREVNWENFSPNFFAIGFPDDFKEISSTFITSFHIPQEKKSLSSELMKTFPTISYISLDAIISEVQSIISKVSQALKLILGLTLIAGLFLMLATIQESFKQREKQNAILKTLGLNRKVMQKNTFMEYLSIGLFSGLLGSMLAVITTFFIEEIVFEINSEIYWEVTFIGAFGSILVVGIIAALFTFYLSSKTPKDVLRGADG